MRYSSIRPCRSSAAERNAARSLGRIRIELTIHTIGARVSPPLAPWACDHALQVRKAATISTGQEPNRIRKGVP